MKKNTPQYVDNLPGDYTYRGWCIFRDRVQGWRVLSPAVAQKDITLYGTHVMSLRDAKDLINMLS